MSEARWGLALLSITVTARPFESLRTASDDTGAMPMLEGCPCADKGYPVSDTDV